MVSFQYVTGVHLCDSCTKELTPTKDCNFRTLKRMEMCMRSLISLNRLNKSSLSPILCDNSALACVYPVSNTSSRETQFIIKYNFFNPERLLIHRSFFSDDIPVQSNITANHGPQRLLTCSSMLLWPLGHSADLVIHMLNLRSFFGLTPKPGYYSSSLTGIGCLDLYSLHMIRF